MSAPLGVGARIGSVARGFAPFSASQAISSLTNFAFALVSARLLGPSSFGFLSVALAVAFFATALSRAYLGETLVSFLPNAKSSERRSLVSGALSLCAVVGMAFFVGMFVSARQLGPSSGLSAALTVVGAFLPFVLVQDLLRYVAFGLRSPGTALLLDVTWAVVQIALSLLLWMLGRFDSLMAVSATWGLGAVGGALVGLAMLRPRLQIGGVREFTRVTRGLAPYSAAQVLVASGVSQALVILLASMIGAAAIGAVRGMQLLFMPITAFGPVIVAYLIPRLAARARNDEESLAAAIRASAMLAAAGLLAAGILIVSSRWLAAFVLGDEYTQFAETSFPLGLAAVALVGALPLNAGLRAVRAGRAVLCSQAVISVVSVPLTVALASRFLAMGFAWAIGAQSLLALVVLLAACHLRIKWSKRQSIRPDEVDYVD